jgi:hypothetical protein
MDTETLAHRFHEAEDHFSRGEVAEALAVLDQLVKAAPNDPNLLHARALTLARLDRTYEALLLCNRLTHEFHDARGDALKAQLPGAHREDEPAPAPVRTPVHADYSRRWRRTSRAIVGLGVGLPLLVAFSVIGAMLLAQGAPSRAHRSTNPGKAPSAASVSGALPVASTSSIAPEASRGIAILASDIGGRYRVEDLVSFMQQGRFSSVVVDWAWITYHWDRTRFEDVNRLLASLEPMDVRMCAMYRPRFLSNPSVAVQTASDGSNAFGHGYEIDYGDAGARRWGAEWGTRILAQCPAFDEIIVYNPRDRSSDASGDAVWTFVRECRDAWRARKHGVAVGVASPADAGFWRAAGDACDAIHPMISVRDDVDVAAELARFVALRKEFGDRVHDALAKVTWEED